MWCCVCVYIYIYIYIYIYNKYRNIIHLNLRCIVLSPDHEGHFVVFNVVHFMHERLGVVDRIGRGVADRGGQWTAVLDVIQGSHRDVVQPV